MVGEAERVTDKRDGSFPGKLAGFHTEAVGRITSIWLAVITGTTLTALGLPFPQNELGISDSTDRLIVWVDNIPGRDTQPAQMGLLDQPNA